MSFIPSIYRSAPQTINASFGANLITSVDRDYSKLGFVGLLSLNGSGVVSPQIFGAELTTDTNVQVTGLTLATFNIFIRVEEFLPLFFRQAFHHASVDITALNLDGTYNSGLTLGPKAFLSFNGSFSTLSGSSGGLSLTEAQVNAGLSLDVGTGIVTATRGQIAYDTGGVLTSFFTIIDPK